MNKRKPKKSQPPQKTAEVHFTGIAAFLNELIGHRMRIEMLEKRIFSFEQELQRIEHMKKVDLFKK